MTDQTGGHYWDLDRYKTDRDLLADKRAEERGQTKPDRLDYRGDASVLFWVALRTVLLTIVTVGFYRFWMITRMRRFYWSAIHIDGDPLEYTGRGMEKLLGFLLAVVILAVYLGAVNLGLTFVGLSFAADDPAVLQASLNLSALSALPFIYFAIYRAHRYMLARTRWRGIRFSLGPGALGYTWRALLLTLLSIVTLGLAYPYQQYKLSKYITDRASFGSLPFRQEGSWGELFAQWIWIYIIAALGGLVVWGFAENPQDGMAAFLAGLVIFFGTTVMVLAFQRYQLVSFRILWSMRSLGDAQFSNDLDAARIIGIYIGGSIATSLLTVLLGGTLGAILVYGGYSLTPEEAILAMNQPGRPPQPEDLMNAAPLLASAVLAYLLFLAIGYAFTHIFVTARVLARKVDGMMVTNKKSLLESRQIEQERAGEAGGFADALGVDVGAGV